MYFHKYMKNENMKITHHFFVQVIDCFHLNFGLHSLNSNIYQI